MPAAGKKFFLTVGIAIAVYLGTRYLLALAAPFFAAWILVRLLYPAAERLRKRLPFPVKGETLTIWLLVLLLAAAGVGLWYLAAGLCTQIRAVVGNLELYERRVERLVGGCCEAVENAFGIPREDTMAFVNTNLESIETRIQERVMPSLFQNSIRWFRALLQGAGLLFLVFIAVVLILKDYREIREKMKAYPMYRHVMNVVGRLWTLGGAWLRAQALIMLAVMGICVAGLWLTGNPYALLAGILIGLLDALPFLGTGTVLLPWAAVCLLEGAYVRAAAYVAVFLAANTAREYLEPRMIGSRMGVYPVVIALVVYLGLCLYGPTGVVLGPLSLLIILEILREIKEKQDEERDLG